MLLVVVVLLVSGAFALVSRKLKRKDFDSWDVPEEILARQIPDEFPAYKKLFRLQDEMSSSFIPFRHS